MVSQDDNHGILEIGSGRQRIKKTAELLVGIAYGVPVADHGIVGFFGESIGIIKEGNMRGNGVEGKEPWCISRHSFQKADGGVVLFERAVVQDIDAREGDHRVDDARRLLLFRGTGKQKERGKQQGLTLGTDQPAADFDAAMTKAAQCINTVGQYGNDTFWPSVVSDSIAQAYNHTDLFGNRYD